MLGPQPVHFQFDELQQMLLASGVVSRLLTACALGGAVGLEREYHRKSSGLRTNMLICFGCALFTFLSAVLAGEGNADKGRVASNIVQGVGFIGAGLILHNRNRVSGLTSAATIFAVASIGMACGAGLYIPAALSTAIVLVALTFVGSLEARFNLKSFSLLYELRGSDVPSLERSALRVLDAQHKRLEDVRSDAIADLRRVSFPVLATLREHRIIEQGLRSERVVDEMLTFKDPEEE